VWHYVDANVLTNGSTYQFSATSTDAAANTSALSANYAATIDTAAPSAPVITGITTDSGTVGDHITSDTSLTIDGTAEANSTVTVYQDGVGAAGGTLILDDSQNFTSGVGVIGGFGVPGFLDLADISYSSSNTLGFVEAGGNTSGTLTVSDGTHTAVLTLLGQYVAGNFTMQSDGHGGTLITDPPVDQQSLLTQPH